MASNDVLWNEVARIVNIEFLQNGQPLTGAHLKALVKNINEMLTEDDASA